MSNNKRIFAKIKCCFNNKKLCAFTLAEILLSLTVIGIVAAIALPSLLGNANERAWETQKKALYTRFSQAIPLLPSLNGYGELVGNLSDCADTSSCYSDSELKDTAAESFIRDGLSKVMKIENICDSEHLSDCNLPEQINPPNNKSAIPLSRIKTMSGLNPLMVHMEYTGYPTYNQIDTKAAGFETVNGESILVYYNPYCEPNLEERAQSAYQIQSKICASFVYDLNGKKGPNIAGKDIGIITALYSSDPVVVAPIPYSDNFMGSMTYSEAIAKCKSLGPEYKLPNVDEMMGVFPSRELFGFEKSHFWTSTMLYNSSIYAWRVSTTTGKKIPYRKENTSFGNARCVKR